MTRDCAARIVEKMRAVGEYDGILRDVIHALKYQHRRSIAARLAVLMRDRGGSILDEAGCVVPVPLHWRRQYQRGFNQAAEIARHLGLPVVDALVRVRHTRAQVELPADRRRLNVENAFAVRTRGHATDLSGMKVVLVDDVSTTGATLEACAAPLKAAGAVAVFALTAARVAAPRTHTDSPTEMRSRAGVVSYAYADHADH